MIRDAPPQTGCIGTIELIRGGERGIELLYTCRLNGRASLSFSFSPARSLSRQSNNRANPNTPVRLGEESFVFSHQALFVFHARVAVRNQIPVEDFVV